MLVHALALSRMGHQVEVWTASHDAAARALDLGLCVFQHSALSSGPRSLFSLRVVRALLQLRLHGVDAIIHQGAKWLLPALLAADQDRQFVVFHNDKLGGRRHFRNWLSLSATHAAELAQIIRKRGISSTVARILNGVLDGPEALSEQGDPTQLRIGVLCELKQHKGIDLLLNAAQHLLSEGLEIHIHIGGAGPEQGLLRSEAERLGLDGRITWHGWVEDLEPFFANFDVFCLPSRREPFGLVLVEAMVRGKIVVASRTKGPSDIIVDGRTGYLVETEDVGALAARLRAVAAEPASALAVAEAGRAHARQAFSLEAVGASLETAILAVYRRRGS